MVSVPWSLRLPFIIFLAVLLAYLTKNQLGIQSDLRGALESLSPQTSDSPARFSSTTNCREFLQQKPTSISYEYGLTDVDGLRDCLLRDEAAHARQDIQEIHIAFPLFSEPDVEQQESLEGLLQVLPNLNSIRCCADSMACGSLHRQLEKWKYKCSEYFTYDREDRASRPLIECNSNSLVYDGGESDEMLNELYHALVKCPNVRSLSLSLSQGGCVIGDTRRSFNWRQGDRFPPLDNLTLSGYDFGTESDALSSAEQWRASMDWSKLKRLDISRPSNSFLETFRGELGGLESLVLRPEYGFWGDEQTLCAFDAKAEELRQNYTSFIAALPPLRELSISGVGELLDMTPILETHGASLEKLSIHEFEDDCRYETGNATWARPVLGVAEVEKLSVRAPNLKELTLDVYRSSNKNNKRSSSMLKDSMLKALSNFSNLDRLTLNFDLEDPSRTRIADPCFVSEQARVEYCTVNELMEPQLNHATANEMFQTIRQYQADDTKLPKATFFAGDFGRREGGGMRLTVHDEWNWALRYDCWMEGDIIRCSGQRDRDWDFDDCDF